MADATLLYLYGGDRRWDAGDWATSDDRVRGGASRSHLSVDDGRRARFHGHLDTQTLGGAGFASQHSRGELSLDLRGYEGVVVHVAAAAPDGKRYALTLKDEVPPRRHDGREQAGVSWEAQFVARAPGRVWLRWDDFRPTYRGRPKEDAAPLKRGHVKRVGLMMRSFFGKQEGDFCLELQSIAAWKKLPAASVVHGEQKDDDDDGDGGEEDLKAVAPRREAGRPWWRSLLCGTV